MNCNYESNDQECMLNGCLFFTSAKLARELGKMADEAFRKTGLSPSHAMLLYIVNLKGGIPQKEIGEMLQIAEATSRSQLVRAKEYLKKKLEKINSCKYAS